MLLIPYTVAVLGGTVKVQTLDGESSLKISEGTPSGKVLKIKGQGVPFLREPSHRGDLFARIEIEVPKKIDESQKKLLLEINKLVPENCTR